MKPLTFLSIALFVIAAALATFGYWGLYTPSGHQQYEEMAGIIPAFALYASPVFAIIAAVLLMIARRSK